MRAYLWFPIGLIVGAAVAWVIHSARDEVPARAAAPAPPATGTASPGGAARPEAPPAETLAPVEAGEAGRAADAAAYHLALATANAAALDRDAALAHLDRALAAGATQSQVACAVAILPEAARRLFLSLLPGRLPEEGFSRTDVADWFTDAGLSKEGFSLLAAAIEAEGADVGDLIPRLVMADPEAAAALLARLSTERGWDGGLLMSIAEALANQERADLARPFLERVLALEPSNLEAVRALAAADPKAGLAAAEAAVRAAPDSATAWGALAEMRRTSGDLKAAFEAWRQAALLAEASDERQAFLVGMLNADPAGALPLLRKFGPEGDDESLGLLGRALAVTGSKEEAFETFLECHRLDDGDAEWLHRLVALDAVRAEALLKNELANAASTPSDEVIGAYATAVLRDGRSDEAFEEFSRAHAMDRTDWEWLRGLARSSPSRAATMLEALREEMPDEGNVIGALGDAYAGMGRRVEAADLYEQAVEKGDSAPRWLAALAAVEPGKGLPKLLAAADQAPGDDEIWGSLGNAYRELGRMEDARKAYDKALALDPTDWEWNLNREQLR